MHTPLLAFLFAGVGVHLLQPGMPHFLEDLVVAAPVVLFFGGAGGWWGRAPQAGTMHTRRYYFQELKDLSAVRPRAQQCRPSQPRAP